MKLLRKILAGYVLAVLVSLGAVLLLSSQIYHAWVRWAVAAGTAAVVLALAVFFAMRAGRRLWHLSRQAERVGAGDLSESIRQRERPSWPDEIDSLATAIEGMRKNYVQVLRTVRSTSQQANLSSSSLTALAKGINVSAGKISNSMEEIARGAELQTDLVNQTSALISEMARSIERTSRSAEDAARSSAEASVVAQSGGTMAGKAVDKMRGVFEGVEKYAQRVFEFGERCTSSQIVRLPLTISSTLPETLSGDKL